MDGKARLVLHRPGDDVGEVAVNPDLFGKHAVNEPLVAVDVACHDFEDVVDASTHRPARDYLWHLRKGPFETLKVCLLVAGKCHLDKYAREGGKAPGRQSGMISPD